MEMMLFMLVHLNLNLKFLLIRVKKVLVSFECYLIFLDIFVQAWILNLFVDLECYFFNS